VSWECISGSESWCFSSSWSPSSLYAPTKAAALESIENLCWTLNALAPLSAGESRADYAGGCSG